MKNPTEINNISRIKDCYGCGVCSIVCSKKIIDIKLNSKGFYQPIITDNSRCIGCGLCLKVCSFVATDNLSIAQKETIRAYAAWSNNFHTRQMCSSGGIAYEISAYCINSGIKVCGVRYDVKQQRAEHYISTTISELKDTVGSKYIQSYSPSGFSKLNRTEKFLVIGTPCQIASIRRYIRLLKIEEHFLLMDFFCHGVPSMNVWNKYIKLFGGIEPITSIAWRNKRYGWHDSWNMHIEGKNKTIESRWTKGDLFYDMFLGNKCLNKACYENCKFKKTSSSADIRIGDFWGEQYENDDKGTSAILIFTDKGERIAAASNIHRVITNIEIITKGQLSAAPSKPKEYWLYMALLRNKHIGLKSIRSIMRSLYYGKRIYQKLFSHE